jgi:tRNA dimethylallyltransferase
MAVAESPLIAIVGPTASGKSALALRVARQYRGEIVSCDSLQVYRGLDIGSAKPTLEERREVPHHLIDVVDPDGAFSAADYGRLARAAVSEIRGRERLPIVVGGTGLYLRALLVGLFDGPGRDDRLRRRFTALAERFGDDRLHRLLVRVDPLAGSRIEARDRVRVVRALEVLWSTGLPISSHHRAGADPLVGFDILVVGLAPDRASLRARVELRTDEMLARGLQREVEGLLGHGYSPDLRPLKAIGYRQMTQVVRGDGTVATARHDIVVATMRYAKRQMTWFRHPTPQEPSVVWCLDGEDAHREVTAWLAGRVP